MIKNYLSFLIFGFVCTLSAQTIKVMDENTLQALPNVAIYTENRGFHVITDERGNAELDSIPKSEILIFQHLSYQKLKIKKSIIQRNKNEVLLRPRSQDIDEIVLSVSKFSQKKREIPQRVVGISSKEITLATPQTSADLLSNSGNVFIQKSQLGGGSPMIRGFATNRLLIIVDDVRMNNAIFRGGNLQNIISIDPFSVQNTEITLGSGSVIYGSDAIGGVMSFYTKKPMLSATDSLYLSTRTAMRYATANGEKTTHANINLGYKYWGAISSFSYSHFDDLKMGSHGPNEYLRPHYVIISNGEDKIVENSNPKIQKPTGYEQYNMMQKFRYQPFQNLTLDLGFHYSETSNFPRYDRLIRYSEEHLKSAAWYYGPQKWFLTNFSLSKNSSLSTLYDKLKLSAAFQNFEESRNDRDFQSSERQIKQESLDAYSLNIDFDKSINQGLEINYGLEYLFNKVKSKAKILNLVDKSTRASVTRYPNGSSWESIAAYISLKYKPNRKFVWQSGLRYNHILAKANLEENNQFLSLPFDKAEINTYALTGSSGITWTPNTIIQWRLNASTAFRAPNIDDIGKVFDSEPGSVVIPNNELSSEYAIGGDLGLKLNFGKSVRFDIATYYTYLDNALVRRNSSINGQIAIDYGGEMSRIQSMQNASKSWLHGFELNMDIKLLESFRIKSHYNVVDGIEETDGEEFNIRHVAPDFGDFHLLYQSKKTTIDAYLVFNGKLSYEELSPSEVAKDYLYALDKKGNPYAPAWQTFNLRSQIQLSDCLDITISMENITDQRYKTYSSGIASAGRNLIVALSFNIGADTKLTNPIGVLSAFYKKKDKCLSIIQNAQNNLNNSSNKDTLVIAPHETSLIKLKKKPQKK